MKCEWRALGTLVESFDHQRVPVATSKRKAGPYPYYGASGVVDHVDGYLFDGEYLLISEDGENLRSRSTPIAFIARGRFWVNNHAHVLKGIPGITDTRFLSHALGATDISGSLSGSAQPKLSQGSLNAIQLRVPPLKEQQAIADVLGALDDKIAANTKAIACIQQLAAATFTHHATQQARLTELARFINGRNYTKEASGTGRVIIRIAELNSGIGGSTVFNDVQAPEANVASPGEILFAWSGSLTLKRWMLPEGIVNQHIFKVIPNEDIPSWLTFHALRTKVTEFKAIAADKATTMGHIQRKHLEVDVPVPSPEAIHTIHESMQALWDLELATEQESQKLAQIRDELLPALMDGRLRVRDAIKRAESVL